MTLPPRPWRIGGRSLGGDRPLLMGILNVTPDSFFDGGRHAGLDAALAAAERMLAEGADILDVGGESSRPGATPVSADEEIARTIPVIAALSRRFPAVLSIDTVKSEVARAALDAGALIVNDISAGEHDPRILELPQAYGAGLVLNHMQGNPRTMQLRPQYGHVVRDVVGYLRQRLGVAAQLGLSADRIAVDPGICFGKTLAHNQALLRNLTEFDALGCPVLVGASRKSFIARIAGLEGSDRLQPSVAVALLAALQGAAILRVHDVKATWEALRTVASIRSSSSEA